jgi:signal transduction histidine kinase
MLLLALMLSLSATLVVGFYIFISDPRSRVHRAFTFFLGTMLLWIVKEIAFWVFHGPNDDAAWWASISFIVSLALNMGFLYFTWIFPENQPVNSKKKWALLLSGAAFVPLILAGKMWSYVGFANNVFRITITPYAYAFGVYVHITLAIGLLAMVRKYQQYRTELWGKQIKFILIGVIITASLSALGNTILPMFGIYDLLPTGSLFILLGVLPYAYAISNFRLFSIQSALDHLRLFPMTYKVACAVMGVGMLGFLFAQVPVVWWSFDATTAVQWKRYLVFSLITALVPGLALIFLIVNILSRPLRRITEAAVEVTRGHYGAQVALVSNDEIGVLADSFNTMSKALEKDILDLKSMSERLLQIEKLATAGMLATGVAHELNNPLASISSLVQILMEREQSPDNLEKLRLIFSQVNRISQILRDMMEFARPKKPERAPVDLNRIIERAMRLVAFDRRFRQLAISTALDPQLPMLSLDHGQLEQVFLNLFLNARDAMPDGGALRVTSRYDQAARAVVVEVHDSGKGIPSEHLERVFDPFFTTKSAGTGTGLGLSICYSIVTAHGGQIAVESARERGTSVRLSFPV